MYARWSTFWHVVVGERTLCGRIVAPKADLSPFPPPRTFMCLTCRRSA